MIDYKHPKHASFRKLTSLGVGGCPLGFFQVHTIKGLERLIEEKELNKAEVRLIGRGTNLLVMEGDLHFYAIALKGDFSNVNLLSDATEAVLLEAYAGASLQLLSKRSMCLGASGLEFAFTIPGSLGGALRMNAGAYGMAMGEVVDSITVYDMDVGQYKLVPADEFLFGYRRFDWTNGRRKRFFFIKAVLKLKKDDKVAIRDRMKNYIELRKSTQPVNVRSCGCVFKNPGPNLPTAGKFIDLAGLKGFSIGGALISPEHANFFINTGEASAEDFLRLIDVSKERVFKQHGVLLEEEIEIWR